MTNTSAAIVSSMDRVFTLSVRACAAGPVFAGRAAERAALREWLSGGAEQPMFVLCGPAGAGKSALAGHWLSHDVPTAAWPRIVWWNCRAGDTPFESFMAGTLERLTGTRPDVDAIPARTQHDRLLDLLRAPGTLVLLDGFERALRGFGGLDAAYRGDDPRRGEEGSERECASPLAESFLRALVTAPGIRGKVLLTTRLWPSAVEAAGGIPAAGCRGWELGGLDPAAGVQLFEARGVPGRREDLEPACTMFELHALSLTLVATRIARDRGAAPGALAALRRLPVSGGPIERQRAAFETAVEALAPGPRRLLDRLACLRHPVTRAMLATLVDLPSLGADLDDLVARGLAQADADRTWFDLHASVRRFAYDRLAASDRARIHAALCDRFAAAPRPARVRSLDELSPGIERYHHAIRAGRHDEALAFVREVLEPGVSYLARHGHCGQSSAQVLIADLFLALCPGGERRSRGFRSPRLALTNAHETVWLLRSLADADSLAGRPHQAAETAAWALDAAGAVGGTQAAFALAAASAKLLPIGALRNAEITARRSVAASRAIGDAHREALAQGVLGLALAYRGAWNESRRALAAGLSTFERAGGIRNQGWAWAGLAFLELLRLRAARSRARRSTARPDPAAAIQRARRALHFADAWTREHYALECDYVHAHGLLGAAHRLAGDWSLSEHHLQDALTRCRTIDMVEHEAPILVELAVLRLDRAPAGRRPVNDADLREAQRLADEALRLTTRGGYVLQAADVHLAIARLAGVRGDADACRAHAADALRLAACDGPPNFTYRAAYDEATALLETMSWSSTT